MKGDCVKPKTNLVNLSISMIFDSRLSTYWKRNTSFSHSWMCICRKTFSISPHNNIGLNLNLVRRRSGFKTLIYWHIFWTWTTFCWGIIHYAYFCCLCCFSHYYLVRYIIFIILALRFLIHFLYHSVLLLISFVSSNVLSWSLHFRLCNTLFSRPRLLNLFVSNGGCFSFQNNFVSYKPSELWLSYFLNSSYTTSSRLTCSSLTSNTSRLHRFL